MVPNQMRYQTALRPVRCYRLGEVAFFAVARKRQPRHTAGAARHGNPVRSGERDRNRRR